MKERGHNVTQIVFEHTNVNVSMESRTHSYVNIVPITIRDPQKECTTYINENGQFDIRVFWSKFLWASGDKLWQYYPIDLFCLTRVHCNMVLNDAALFSALNASNYDLGANIINYRMMFLTVLHLILYGY